jgi:hypothetical protein
VRYTCGERPLVRPERQKEGGSNRTVQSKGNIMVAVQKVKKLGLCVTDVTQIE